MSMADGTALPLRAWLPKDPAGKPRDVIGVIVALHGFNDHSLGMEVPGAGMARRGYAVYAYDQRGFGKTPQRGIWPGETQLTADLRTAIALLRARYPGKPVYVLGESMGGAVAMVAAAEKAGLAVDGLILASPATWGWETLTPLYRDFLDIAAHTIPWMTVTPRTISVQASNNISALRKMGRDKLVIRATRVDAAYGLVNLMSAAYRAVPDICQPERGTPPCFIAYGGREDILDQGAVTQTLQRFRQLPPQGARLALYRYGYHLLLRDLDARKVFDDIAVWLADPSQPLPSGADRLPGD
ncbi:alpha/beta fold hydrolase [Dongia sp.]|uniref:alpha/beta fold hydrolase n=1 Tax=Dongia sp. TaxID=1977262 RepID=UPI0035B2DE31